MGKIVVRLDLINSGSRAGDFCLGSLKLTQVPSRGEIINYRGNPYIIHERSWAYGSGVETEQHAYLRVCTLQAAQALPIGIVPSACSHPDSLGKCMNKEHCMKIGRCFKLLSDDCGRNG